MAEQPWHELPPEIAGGASPVTGRRRRRDDRGGRGRVPAYARPLRGPVRGRAPRRRAGGPAPLPRRDRGRRPGGALGRVPRARPWRDARGAEPRVAAERLPRRRAGRLAAVRRRRRRRPGSSPTRCTCWRSRSSPTSTCSRPSRPRATRSSSRPPPARPSCAAGGWCGCCVRDPPPIRARSRRPRARPAGRCRGRSRCWRSAASGATRRLRACPPGAIAEAIGELAVRSCCPTPTGPGRRSEIERAVVDAGAQPPASARPSTGQTAAVSFARARGALRLAEGAPGADRRPRARRRVAAAAATAAGAASWPPTASRRWLSCRRDRAAA